MKPLKTFGLAVMTKVLMIPLLALFGLVVMPAAAQVNYAVSGGTAYVAKSPNASGNIVITSTYNGYPVTRIEFEAFDRCTGLTNVTIPNSVTNIGRYAFRYCTSLTNVILGSSVATI